VVLSTEFLVGAGIVVGLSCILSIVALILSISSLIKSIGAERSTHTMQYVPIDPEIDAENEKFVEKWATTEKAISKEKELYQDELNDEMPFFTPSNDDKEIFSL